MCIVGCVNIAFYAEPVTTSLCVYLPVYIVLCACLCMCVSVCLLCVYVYVCVCLCVRTYAHIYVHGCTFKGQCVGIEAVQVVVNITSLLTMIRMPCGMPQNHSVP